MAKKGGKWVLGIFKAGAKAGEELPAAADEAAALIAEINKLRKVRKAAKVSEEIRAMMRSQKIAPDLLDKGVHFNVGRMELKAVPNNASGLVFKPVHPGMAARDPKTFQAAVKQANEALAVPGFQSMACKVRK